MTATAAESGDDSDEEAAPAPDVSYDEGPASESAVNSDSDNTPSLAGSPPKELWYSLGYMIT